MTEENNEKFDDMAAMEFKTEKIQFYPEDLEKYDNGRTN